MTARKENRRVVIQNLQADIQDMSLQIRLYIYMPLPCQGHISATCWNHNGMMWSFLGTFHEVIIDQDLAFLKEMHERLERMCPISQLIFGNPPLEKVHNTLTKYTGLV